VGAQPTPIEETSAGGVVFRRGNGDQPVFLLIRDSYRNWGLPKGHLEAGEEAADAALREVAEETGLTDLMLRAPIQEIDWFFRFRRRLIHKTCAFFLMESVSGEPCPQRDEGITACRWLPFAAAVKAVSYANAREVLNAAGQIVEGLGPP
jgi:8-oxo-dGTP pyrophosphatase MutT (NUDIX family)